MQASSFGRGPDRSGRHVLRPLLGALALGLASAGAQAQLYTTSLGSLNNSTQAIGLGFRFDFLGTSYTSIYLNSQGYVTLGEFAQGNFPAPLNSQTLAPMVAPFWTNMYAPSNAGTYLSQTAQQTVVTWDQEAFAYFGAGTATFQLVLNDPAAVPVGEGTIGFFYGDIDPVVPQGFPADSRAVSFAGFGDGLSAINPGESAYAGGATQPVGAQLANTHVWFNVNTGVPTPVPAVPEPETYALMLVGLGVLGALARRRKKG